MRHKSVPGFRWPVATNSKTKTKGHPERSQAKRKAIGSAESKDPQSPMPAAAGSSHDESAVLLLFLLRRCLFRCGFLLVRMSHLLLSRLPRPRRTFHFCAAFVFAALLRLL